MTESACNRHVHARCSWRLLLTVTLLTKINSRRPQSYQTPVTPQPGRFIVWQSSLAKKIVLSCLRPLSYQVKILGRPPPHLTTRMMTIIGNSTFMRIRSNKFQTSDSYQCTPFLFKFTCANEQSPQVVRFCAVHIFAFHRYRDIDSMCADDSSGFPR